MVELAAAGAQAADVLRVAGTVALGNGSDRKAMRGVLKEAGHEVRDALKDAMHEVRDAAKRILGDCDEANAEGLVSRLEHDLDEVAEVHEEFERALSRAPAPVVVTIPARTSELADPYRAVVEGAIRDVERELADLNSEIAKLRSR